MTFSVIDDIKEKLDLVELIEGYVPLQRAGKQYKASCPFHEDRKPSLIVWPDSQRWKCFGCGKGGDLFDFVAAREGWDLSQAVRHLAGKAGVQLRPLSQEEQRQVEIKRTLEGVFGVALQFFQERMASKDSLGLDYALSRGWTRDTILEAALGYFGKDWDGLKKYLVQANIDLESPAAVALVGFKGDVAGWASSKVVHAAGKWIEDRKIPAMPPGLLVYPHLVRGRVTYLSGRWIEPKEDGPKSWNPPSELVGAKQICFNHRWWGTPSPAGFAVVVEGQGDGVTLGEWGIPAVALVGTDPGSGARRNGDRADNFLLSELKRAVKNERRVLIGLDTDDAGQQGIRNLAGALLSSGLTAQQFGVVQWPAHDANDWLKEGGTAEEAQLLLERSPAWLDFLIDDARPGPHGQDEKAIRAVFGALAGLDQYEAERVREKVCEALNFRRGSFDGLLKAARRDAGMSDDGLPRYFIDAGRIFYRYYDSGGSEVLDALCNFEAAIAEDVLRDNGQDVVREFRIAGTIGKRTLPAARVRADEFSKMDWILRDWGSRAIVEAGARRRDQLRTAIQYLSREVDRRTIYTHTGWREVDGKMVYLSAAGAIGIEGVEVELDQDLELYRLPAEAVDPAGAMRESLKFLDLAPARVTVPLWAAMFLAPLREIVNVAFAMWLFGRSGTMKSTIAALALNHYGAGFDDKHMPAGFTDTANRMEQKAFVVKDAPLIIDDFAPQKDLRSHQEYSRAAHRIVRDAGNLSGRGRLNADSTAKSTYVPRSLIIITGEDLPTSESLVARLFVVEVDKDDVDLPKLTALQTARERLSHGMVAYLAWLAENWTGFEQTLPERWRHYRAQAFGDGLHLRLPEAVAGLALGYEMGLRFAQSRGVLSVDGSEYKSLMDLGWDALIEGASQMVERVQEEKPEELFIRTIQELLTQGKIFFKSRSNMGVPMGGPDERSEMMGWYDDDFLYMLPDASWSRVKRHFRDNGDVFPVGEQTLRKHLHEAGILRARVDSLGKNRLSPVEFLEGRSQRVLILRRDRVLGSQAPATENNEAEGGSE